MTALRIFHAGLGVLAALAVIVLVATLVAA